MKQGPRSITRIALAAATAAVLSMVPLFRMPMGGQVSLRGIPLVLISLTGGFRQGVTAGIIYGILDLFTGASVVHWIQLLLDYPMAFACLGFSGLLVWKNDRLTDSWGLLFLAIFMGFLGRFSCHFISGAIFFGSYAPQGWNPWKYSAVYNSYYLIPEFLLTAGVLLFTPILRQSRKMGVANG